MTSLQFEKANRIGWSKCIHKIFPTTVPQRYEFITKQDIVRVLSLISGGDLNYVLFPDRGGLELEAAYLKDEFFVLNCGGISYGVQPENLVFHSFGTQLEWCYLRLNVLSWIRLDTKESEAHPKGTFLILAKSAPYNQIAGTDNGQHSRMTDEQFSTLIQGFHDQVSALGI